MTILYKLTDQDGYTRRQFSNACLWGPGISHSGTGEGDLCGPGYIHAYTSPLLAVLLNPIHADFAEPRLWEAEGEVVKSDNGLKVGVVTLTTVRELPLPVVTTEQLVRFAILCTKAVCSDPTWNARADNRLTGADRAGATASAAAWEARAAAEAAKTLDLIAIAEEACREQEVTS